MSFIVSENARAIVLTRAYSVAITSDRPFTQVRLSPSKRQVRVPIPDRSFITALGFTGTDTLLINGVSGAWQVVVVWVFIQFIGTLDRSLVHLPPYFLADLMSSYSRPSGTKETIDHRSDLDGHLPSVASRDRE